MWSRKSDLEIQVPRQAKEKDKQSLRRPLVFGCVFGLLFMLIQYLGYRGGARGVYLFSSQTGFSWQTFYFGIFGFLMFFFLSRYHQKRGVPLFDALDALLCGECKEPSEANPEKICRGCGGRLEPFEHFTWEE